MKYLKIFILPLLTAIIMISCQEDDQQFGDIIVPSNLTINAEIVGATEDSPGGDGSGLVNFTATADNAITYKFVFGDNTEAQDSDGIIQKTYNLNGLNDYNVTFIAFGTGGVSSSITTTISVRSDFEDNETRDLLTGGDGNSKTWYVAFAESAHLGVGPTDSTNPDFFSASPNLLADCFYDDVITMSLDGNNISFVHENQGVTFFNQEFVSVGGGVGNGEDQCQPFDVSGIKSVSLSAASSIVPENQTTGTALTISDNGFMNYFINTSTYEVISITENSMSLRALSGSANPLAWYFRLTTNPDGSIDD